jgi:hypothetical protein
LIARTRVHLPPHAGRPYLLRRYTQTQQRERDARLYQRRRLRRSSHPRQRASACFVENQNQQCDAILLQRCQSGGPASVSRGWRQPRGDRLCRVPRRHPARRHRLFLFSPRHALQLRSDCSRCPVFWQGGFIVRMMISFPQSLLQPLLNLKRPPRRCKGLHYIGLPV